MYRARSTSAAPTYFEPYFHYGKGQSYIDGALLRNNPVQLIDEERHMIWKDRSPPDIILSVGTGIQADTGGETKSVSKRAKIAKRLIPKGLRGKIAVGLDMIQSTLDCDRQWSEFLSSTKRDPNISSICHRINIGLRDRPPNLDDVEAIPSLKQEAKAYLRSEEQQYLDKRYRSAHEHTIIVARRLTGALFYFEEDGKSTNEKVVGSIHCRLSAEMVKPFEKLARANPSFYVTSHGSPVDLRLETTFDLKSFSAGVSFGRPVSPKWVIQLQMDGWAKKETISGFSKV
jgi:hypothetical protein